MTSFLFQFLLYILALIVGSALYIASGLALYYVYCYFKGETIT